jgi:putative SOS response-associated peptidase YedK
VSANDDVAPYHDRQMAVLTRAQRLDWLDATIPKEALLRPLPRGSFRVRELGLSEARQRTLAI